MWCKWGVECVKRHLEGRQRFQRQQPAEIEIFVPALWGLAVWRQAFVTSEWLLTAELRVMAAAQGPFLVAPFLWLRVKMDIKPEAQLSTCLVCLTEPVCRARNSQDEQGRRCYEPTRSSSSCSLLCPRGSASIREGRCGPTIHSTSLTGIRRYLWKEWSTYRFSSIDCLLHVTSKKTHKTEQMSISVLRWIEFSCILKVLSPFFIILPQAEGSVLGPVQ